MIGFFIHGQDYGFYMNTNEGDSSSAIYIAMHDGKIAVSELTEGNIDKMNWALIDPNANMAYIIVTEDGQKLAISMDLPQNEVSASDDNSNKNISIKPSGQTQVIDGYNCKEIIAEDGESVSSIWITQDIPLDYFEIIRVFDRLDSEKGSQFDGFNLKGIPMKTETTYQDGHAETMTISGITKTIDLSMFSLEGFQVMSFEEAIGGMK